MLLERGHAPLAKVNVDAYLDNPAGNSEMLLCEDENFGEIAKSVDGYNIFDSSGTKYVVIVTDYAASFLELIEPVSELQATSRPTFETYENIYDIDHALHPTWRGTPDYGYAKYYTVNDYVFGQLENDYSNCNVYQAGIKTINDVPFNQTVFAIQAEIAFNGGFLDVMRKYAPQLLQTIKAMFIVTESMITRVSTFKMLGYTCYLVAGNDLLSHPLKISREMFGYDERYSDIAKLYTFPYAELEISNGSKSVRVKIEDISKNAHAVQRVSLAYPFLNWACIIHGIQGNKSETLYWKQINDLVDEAEIYFDNWRELTFDYDIPTFALFQRAVYDAELHNYSSDVELARSSAIRSYHASNRVENENYWNSIDTADLAIANTALTTAANSAINASQNAFTSSTTELNNDKLTYSTIEDNLVNSVISHVENTAAAMTAQNNNSANNISAAVSGIGQLATGNILGGISTIGSAALSTIQNNANTSISIGANQAVTTIQNAANTAKKNLSNNVATDITDMQTSTATSITNTNNDLATATTANSANLTKMVAWYAREDAHAADTNVLENAQDAISAKYNDLRRAANIQIGGWNVPTYEDQQHSRSVQVTVKTQRKDDIARAGDAFLRYGYRLNRYWDFETFNVMPKYTYWQCSDIRMISNCTSNERQQIIDILQAGVTIWNNADDIAITSIYDNRNEVQNEIY